jgi:hypothetical protein
VAVAKLTPDDRVVPYTDCGDYTSDMGKESIRRKSYREVRRWFSGNCCRSGLLELPNDPIIGGCRFLYGSVVSVEPRNLVAGIRSPRRCSGFTSTSHVFRRTCIND